MPPTHPMIEELIFQNWTQELYREVESIYQAHSLKLPVPFIRLAKIEGKWGTFEGLTRTITLNPELITRYGWHVTTQVLRHELAHLYMHTRYPHMPPHGEAFKVACTHLGVEPWAASASGGLPEDLQPSLHPREGDEADRLLKKVEKLLNLAQSSNEHEALLAMQRVQELYARYNLERLRDKRSASWVRAVIELKKKRMDKNTRMIGSILLGHFFVKIVQSQQFDPHMLEHYQVLHILGTRENVQMAEYVYHFLQNQTNRLFEAQREVLNTRRTSRADFVLGVLIGFRRKLEDEKNVVFQRAAQTSEGSASSTTASVALIRAEDPELERFQHRLYPQVVSVRGNFQYRDAAAFQAGKAEGHKLVIHKGLEQSGGTGGGRLLGSG